MAARWRHLLTLTIISIFAASASIGITSGHGAGVPGRIHDAVWRYGDLHPRQDVPVIVQAQPGSDAASAVAAAGGTVRADLGIIRAVAADVPADALATLAYDRDVAWVSLDGPVASTGRRDDPDGRRAKRDESPPSVYPQAIGADDLWAEGDLGQGLAVAVVDTGIVNSPDFGSPRRIVATVTRDRSRTDGYGHGSHVAGLIAGNGAQSDGRYTGVAPQVNLVNVKVGDDRGSATVSDVINGLQYVLENKDRYNIRVVNLSLLSGIAQSYTTDPLDAAVELLTFRGILVVAAAGNSGTAADAVGYAPANDPFVLTVGAVDDMGTAGLSDDATAPWSSRGTTQDGFAKPDVYAPGRHLVSVLSPHSVIAQEMPQNVIGEHYLQLSGTSMAAGVASGAAALLIHQHPDWTPGQVKTALVAGAVALPADGSPLVQVDRSADLHDVSDASLTIKPNDLLLRAAGVVDPESITWGSITWGSIRWGSITWGSIRWGSITWGSIRWGYVPE